MLGELAALELIRITEDDSKETFFALVSILRSKNADLTLEEITAEVEAVKRENFEMVANRVVEDPFFRKLECPYLRNVKNRGRITLFKPDGIEYSQYTLLTCFYIITVQIKFYRSFNVNIKTYQTISRVFRYNN